MNKICSNENCGGMNDGRKDEIKIEIENYFSKIIESCGFDLEDQQLKDTPKRWAKMMVDELLWGTYNKEPEVTIFKNTKEYDEMVFLGPIQIKSICSHHWLPFIGQAYIAYIPDKYVCGISKLSRIVRWFMRRPQIQEELTKQIADYIEEKLEPKGIGVYIKAQHHCMIIRGVEEYDSWMKTDAVRGVFRNFDTRQEFFNMVKQ